MMHLKHTYTDLLPNPDAGFGALTEVYNTLLQNGPHADSHGTKNLPRSNFFCPNAVSKNLQIGKVL